MRTFKRRTRYLHKLQYQICKEAKNPQDKKSRWGIRAFGRRNVEPHEHWGSKLWRKKFFYRIKKNRQAVFKGIANLQSGYIEDCRYHPCKITNIESNPDWGHLDVDCESLISRKPNSCSYFHCGIIPLTEKEAFERRDFAINYGMIPYHYQYIVDPTDIVNEILIQHIRCGMYMDSVWKFNENGGTVEITPEGELWLKNKFNIDYSLLTPLSEKEMNDLRNT